MVLEAGRTKSMAVASDSIYEFLPSYWWDALQRPEVSTGHHIGSRNGLANLSLFLLSH